MAAPACWRRAGRRCLRAGRARLDRFYQKTGTLRRLRVLEAGRAAHPAFWSRDDGKILVDGRGAGLTGAALAQALRARRLEPEMQTGTLLLAMTSLADAADALDNLAEAPRRGGGGNPRKLAAAAGGNRTAGPRGGGFADRRGAAPPARALPGSGRRRPHGGRVCLGLPAPAFRCLPPGERITPAFFAAADALEAAGTRLHHTRARLPGSVETLAEE